MATSYTSTSSSSAGDTVWLTWCNNTATTSTASSISTADAWFAWNGTAATTTSTSTVWYRWVGDGYQGAVTQARGDTPEEIAEQERQVQEARERMQERNRIMQLAEERAEQCLLEHLDVEQREQWRARKHFIVRGRSGRRYRIRSFSIGNIDAIDRGGRITHRLCVHAYDIPKADNLLAQKLHLEADDDYVERIANRHGVHQANEQVLPALS